MKRQEAGGASDAVTGNDNLDKAQQQLAKIQGPNRIVAELSMAKLDRAVYSNRQLEAVMEDFWFNHFNVFANKGDGPVDAHCLHARHDSAAHHGEVSATCCSPRRKSPAMLFFLDNWLERRSRRRRSAGARDGDAPRRAGASAAALCRRLRDVPAADGRPAQLGAATNRAAKSRIAA